MRRPDCIFGVGLRFFFSFFFWVWTTVGDASATCGDDKSRVAVAMGMDKIADKGQQQASVLDSSRAPGASLASQRVHALSNARAERVGRGAMDRADRPVDHQRSDSPRAVRHRRAAIRTPVVLLSARRQQCCTSAQFPRIRLPTFSDRRTSPMAVDPDC